MKKIFVIAAVGFCAVLIFFACLIPANSMMVEIDGKRLASRDVTRIEQDAEDESVPLAATPDRIDTLLKDLGIPKVDWVQFQKAIEGGVGAQRYLRNNASGDGVIYEIIGWSGRTLAVDCMLNIAELYYDGYKELPSDKEQALSWLLAAAEQRCYDAALWAGDMLMLGDGVPKDKEQAFALYRKALTINSTAEVNLRLGDCHYYGYGTAGDRSLAFTLHTMAALNGVPEGIERLATLYDAGDKTILAKAYASTDFRDNYWNIAYGEPGSYEAENAKAAVTNRLYEAWDQGSDAAALSLQGAREGNAYFSADFLTQIKRMMYAYSFYSYTAEHICLPNVKSGDIDFVEPEPEGELDYISLDWGFGMGMGVYQYDLDGDGVDEIYGPYHSGAGGAHSGNPILVLEQEASGQYYLSGAWGGYDHRAGLYLNEIDGNCYFLVNPISDSGEKPYDVDIIRYVGNGQFAAAYLECADFRPKSVVSTTNDAYITKKGLEEMLETIRTQAVDAIDMSRRSLLYSPEKESAWVSTYSRQGSWYGNSTAEAKDVRISCNFNNEGSYEEIIKGHYVDDSGKYYYDVFRVDVFESEEEAAAAAPVTMLDYSSLEYYGNSCYGNLYDILPIEGDICQFWMAQQDWVNYAVVMTRHGMTYTLHVFLVEGQKVTTLHKELFLDEFNSINITFDAYGINDR